MVVGLHRDGVACPDRFLRRAGVRLVAGHIEGSTPERRHTRKAAHPKSSTPERQHTRKAAHPKGSALEGSALEGSACGKVTHARKAHMKPPPAVERSNPVNRSAIMFSDANL
ncbi:hypothetical protein Pme01_58150 [Planosporangium mesophilum]|uniref:Uncharacterized protein n=1 Tax=Planosporangium mesophilum TaxID=689768 RepID=A0A8J3TGV1_9ACTN|nr:hypothetical protein Pme01_58150 [Planosporangium mesophilum]